MKRISILVITLTAAALLAACGQPVDNAKPSNATVPNTNANSAKPVAAAPTKDALMTLEKAGWEAWKNRDGKWAEDNYTEKGFSILI